MWTRGWYVALDEYLERPNPYVEGNQHWVDTFTNQALVGAKRAPGRQTLLHPHRYRGDGASSITRPSCAKWASRPGLILGPECTTCSNVWTKRV